jgi:FG-GAP-like repeat
VDCVSNSISLSAETILTGISGPHSLDTMRFRFCARHFAFFLVASVSSMSQVGPAKSATVSSPYPPLFVSATYKVGLSPVSVVVADFNGDGHPDIAIANEKSSTVSVLINRGDGTFEPRVDYKTGKLPSQVVVGDFNKDGKVDLAVANFGDSSISIFFGRGDGTFQRRKDTYLATGDALTLAAIDEDGDGRLDLVIGPADVTLLGNGDGTFQPPINFFLNSGSSLSYLIVTPLNGDYRLIGTMNDYAPYMVEELFAEPRGNWLNYADVIPDGPYTHIGQLAGGNIFNGDVGGVAVTWPGQNQVFLCAPNGDGVLGGLQNVDVGTGPVGIALADFTGDNRVDVVTANSGSKNITFLRGNGKGALSGRTDYAVGNSPQSIAVADFDGNGREDVVVTNSGDATVTTLMQSTVALSHTSLLFSKEPVGKTSAAKAVVLFNAGTTVLDVGTISTSGDFSLQSTTCGQTLASGASCKVKVVFQPTAAGTRSGALLIIDDAIGSPQTVALSGTGS